MTIGIDWSIFDRHQNDRPSPQERKNIVSGAMRAPFEHANFIS